MGHLIKGEVNGTSSRQEKDSYIFIIRTGLAHYVYCYMNNFQELKFISSYAVLDEAINCIQTTDVMKEILALGEFVDDSNIQSFIDSLDRDDMLQDHGYETIVKLVHSYWDQDEFKNLIESHIIDGNIDTILEKFDGVLGENTFDTMSYILDQIYELEGIDPDDPKIDDWITAFKASADAYKKHVKINQKVK